MTEPSFTANPGKCPHCGDRHTDHDNCEERENE